MNRARWRDRIGPPVTVLGTALLLTAIAPASSIGSATAAAGCPPAAGIVGARDRWTVEGRGRIGLSPQITADGEWVGQRLAIETDAGARVIDLPAESFVGRPGGDLLLYTSYTAAAGSTVHLVDVASGCDALAASPAEVVRSAALAPDGRSLYVHSVTRVGRRDNGVQRVELETGAAALAVAPSDWSDAFGPTFGTELRWSVDGSALAVQSCGFEACRTRVLDLVTGSVATYAAAGQGALIALTDRHLVTFGACAGRPCSVLGVDRASGETTVLADAAWSASARSMAAGAALVTIETPAGITEVVQ